MLTDEVLALAEKCGAYIERRRFTEDVTQVCMRPEHLEAFAAALAREQEAQPAHDWRDEVGGMDSESLAAQPAAQEPSELREVLESVHQQFKLHGNNFPDGFDSRVFGWVADALAAPPAAQKP